ncbi:hypothetical protein DSECCO2_407490 [anaerobic digester metagenome]
MAPDLIRPLWEDLDHIPIYGLTVVDRVKDFLDGLNGFGDLFLLFIMNIQVILMTPGLI